MKTAMAVGKAILRKALDDKTVDAKRIAVVGFSQGSMVAFVSGLNSKDVKAVAVLGFGGKSTDPLKEVDVSRIGAPLLILEGSADRQSDADVYRAVEKGLKDANKSVTLKIYPGLRHDDLCGDRKYLDDLLLFVKENLK